MNSYNKDYHRQIINSRIVSALNKTSKPLTHHACISTLSHKALLMKTFSSMM